MKRILAVAVLFLTPFWVSAATLSVSPASQSVNVGDTFTVAINMDTQGASIDGVDLRYMNFNPSILQVQGTQITSGSLMPTTLANSVNNSLGRITFSQVAAGGQKYKGSGTLATVTFKALSAGTANFTFDYASGKTTDSNVAAGGVDILSSVINGSYTVANSSGGGSGGGGGGGSGGSSGSSSGSSGGGGGGGSSSGGSSSSVSSATATGCTSTGVKFVLTRNLSRGSQGVDVTNLQQFLVSQGYLTADGVTGYFGPMTEAALQKFQSAQGLVSYGDPISTGYGNAGSLTRARINSMAGYVSGGCAVSATVAVQTGSALNRNLSRGSEGSDVATLQNFLTNQGFLAVGNATGYFGPMTEAALQKFQAAQGIVSSGNPMTTGYGNCGPGTRTRINAMLGNQGASATAGSNEALRAQIQAMQKQVQDLLLKLQNTH